MGWTQAQCYGCFQSEQPGREPNRAMGDAGEWETCCTCGALTTAGIYVRKDPKTVRFPS